jgi:hypothetical protein
LADLRGDCIAEVEKICTKTVKGNRSYSAFNPLSVETARIFRAILDGGNHINGLTNASILKAIFPDASVDDKKVSNKVTRLLAKLKAHGLIKKIPRSFRYKITPRGIRIITAALSIKNKIVPDAMKAS